MTEDKERNLEIQREIRAGRKFSLADLISQEGGNFLKGESPVPKLVQAITEINNFISRNLQDSSGALEPILQKWVKNDQATVSSHLNTPLLALKEILEKILNNPQLLYELVKEVDFKWGQIYNERPYFQKPGQPAHPDDEHSHESVYKNLSDLLDKTRSNL